MIWSTVGKVGLVVPMVPGARCRNSRAASSPQTSRWPASSSPSGQRPGQPAGSTPVSAARPLPGLGDDHALEVRQPGLAVAGQPGEVLRPRVVELERPPAAVGDLGRVRNVPDLALDVIVAAVHALAQAV